MRTNLGKEKMMLGQSTIATIKKHEYNKLSEHYGALTFLEFKEGSKGDQEKGQQYSTYVVTVDLASIGTGGTKGEQISIHISYTPENYEKLSQMSKYTPIDFEDAIVSYFIKKEWGRDNVVPSVVANRIVLATNQNQSNAKK